MTTRTKHISSGWLIGLILLGLAGLAAGTVFDLPIDQFLYSPNALWAKVFAAAAPAPAFWGLSAAGYLMIDVYGQKKAGWIAWLIAFGLFLIGPLYMADSFNDEMGLSWAVSWCTGLLVSALPGVLYGILMRKADEKDKKACMWILLIVCLGSVAIVQGGKRFWSRPRYVAMMENSELGFHEWYEFGRATAVQFADLYERSHDLFRSFPSGHTQSAACLFVWALIPVFTRKGSVNFAMIVALCFSIITGFSRLVLGQHFLSDVSAGFLVPVVLFSLCCWAWRLTKKDPSLKDEDEDEDWEDDDEADEEEEDYEEDTAKTEPETVPQARSEAVPEVKEEPAAAVVEEETITEVPVEETVAVETETTEASPESTDEEPETAAVENAVVEEIPVQETEESTVPEKQVEEDEKPKSNQ